MDMHMYGYAHVWICTCMDMHMYGYADVWICTCMDMQINQLLRYNAEIYGYQFIDNGYIRDEHLKSDGVNLNKEGVCLLANNFLSFFLCTDFFLLKKKPSAHGLA